MEAVVALKSVVFTLLTVCFGVGLIIGIFIGVNIRLREN